MSNPGDIALSWQAGVYSISFVALAVVLIGFPATIFNSTFTANYDRIMRFRKGKHRKRKQTPGWARIGMGIFSAAAISTLANPHIQLDTSGLIVLIATTIASLITCGVVELPLWWVLRRQGISQRQARLYPGGFIIAGAFAALTRLATLQPGYIYGTLAGMTYQNPDSKDKHLHGKLTATGFALLAFVGLSAWLARVPVHAALEQHPRSTLLLLATASLGAIFVTSVQSAVFGLLPLRFLNGADVAAWSRLSWALLQIALACGFVYIFLSPAAPHTQGTSNVFPALILFAAFAVFSFAFWAYFRLRPTQQTNNSNQER